MLKPFVLFASIIISTGIASAVENDRIVHIIGSSSTQPYMIADGNRGIAAEIIKSAFATKGYKTEFTYTTNLRVQRALLTKTVDAAFNMPNKEASSIYYSEPIVHYENVAITLQENDFNIKKISDLKGKSVLVFQNARTFLGETFEKTIPEMKSYTEVSSQREQIKALHEGKVDVIVMDKHIYDYFIHNPYYENEKNSLRIKPYSLHKVFKKDPRHLVFHNEAMRNLFNEGLRQIQLTGEFEHIQKKYTPKENKAD